MRHCRTETNRPARWPTPVLAIVLVGALAGCNASNTYAPPPPPAVTVAHPVQQDVTRYLNLTGSITAARSVALMARVQGTLQSIDYKDGSVVKKGEQLFLIDPAAYQAQLAQAEAGVAQANASLVNAQSDYDRKKALGTQDVTAKAVVESAKASLDAAQAQVDSAKAGVELAKLNLGYTSVTAPFDGLATAHLVDVGALVGYGGPTQLATVVQLDPVDVSFNVSETAVLRIRAALKAEGLTVQTLGPIAVEVGTSIDDSYPYQGTIDYIAPQVDTQTGTLALRAAIKNPGYALLPGLFVRVRIATSTDKNALLVPSAAIGTDQQGSYVLVVDDKNVARQVPVETSAGPDGFQVVDKGLTVDDWVVVGGLDRTVPDGEVKPTQTTVAPPPASLPPPGPAQSPPAK